MYNFTYTVTSSGSCMDDSAILTLDIEQAPNAGMDGTTGICEGGSTIIDLESALNGTPDAGGTWTDDDATGVDISDPIDVDFTGVSSGAVSYTHLTLPTICSV